MADRVGTYARTTGETDVRVSVNLDGTGTSSVETGNGMLDHMLSQISRHGLIDLNVKVEGDADRTGWHHTVEDTAIGVGRGFLAAVGDGKGIRRMGHALVPLDEALSRVALDISGRGYAVVDLGVSGVDIDGLPGDLVRHFLEAFAIESRMSLHAGVLAGVNPHHKIEATFKALARALRDAVELDPRAGKQVPSTKGTISAD